MVVRGPASDDEAFLDFNVIHWPSLQDGCYYTLKLEGIDHPAHDENLRAQKRNLIRLEKAKERKDIRTLNIHYTCCVDRTQLQAIQSLFSFDDRDWQGFTMTGINDIRDFYAPRASSDDISFLFHAVRKVRKLHLHSCTVNRGHGLETMLSKLSSFPQLEELSMIGWQIDRVSASILANSLQRQDGKAIRALSFRSCCFLGHRAFQQIVNSLESIEGVNTFDIGYCNLGDTDIIPLIEALQDCPSIESLNLEYNFCQTQSSVSKLATWICDDNCTLKSLNARRLWTGFTEEGLEQRFVDMEPLFDAIARNSSLENIGISENHLGDAEILQLRRSLLSRRQRRTLSALDVRVNPFGERGAKTLFRLVRELDSIEAIHFENPFIDYECGELIKIQAEINYYRRYMGKSIDIPLSLWPNALDRIQQGTKQQKSVESFNRSQNHIYRLLRTRTGSYGKELSFRIALHNRQGIQFSQR